MIYLPEGRIINTAENREYLKNAKSLKKASKRGAILEAWAEACDAAHNIIVESESFRGIIPRDEGAVGISEGAVRDVALTTRVGKPVCFKVLDANDETAILSRRSAQVDCYKNYIDKLVPGDVIPATVTRLDKFGAFTDVSCGISSLIPLSAISVSRISHPADRFNVAQEIKAVFKGYDENCKIMLTHKELLGTWQENAQLFSAGDTVTGIVRSVEDYGVFIELTPNLVGLAETRNMKVNSRVRVYIKSILHEKEKIKLVILDVIDPPTMHQTQSSSPQIKEHLEKFPKLKYFFNSAHMDFWNYNNVGNSSKNPITSRF